jgi:ABC-2 type transport system ATP-binding protein
VAETLLALERVTRRYGERVALEGIDLEVAPGEMVGLVGPNGAGKSTLLRLCVGLLAPTEGKVSVLGGTPYTRRVRSGFGYLPDEPALYGEMRVRAAVTFMARLAGVPRREIGERVEWALERCNLDEVADRIVARLSRGFRQRVGLAQALVHRPRLLLLDEPATGLDPLQLRSLERTLKNLPGAPGILLSSHLLAHVTSLCSRVVVIDRGRIREEGSPRAVARNLIGARRVNLTLRGERSAVEAGLEQAAAKVLALTAVDGDWQATAEVPTEARDTLVADLVTAGLQVLEVADVGFDEAFIEGLGQQP